jgi:hypothetical protein
MQVEGIDTALDQQRIDTEYQKGQTNSQAKQTQAQTADVMAARGIFSSSIADGARYDIEAQRMLANTFLDDKMTEATLSAGTQKTLLADAKKNFDANMLIKQTQNAQGVNDTNSRAWADAMASWVPPKPAKIGPAPAIKPPASAAARRPNGPGSTNPNQQQGSGSTNPRLVGTAGRTTVGLGRAPKNPKP